MILTRNPAQPSEVVGEVPEAAWQDVDRDLSTLVAMAPDWGSLARSRADALHQWADRVAAAGEALASLVSREVGKPIVEAQAEVARSIAILRYYAQAAYDPSGELFPSPDGKSTLMAERRPLGTVLLVTPFNFPLAIPLWKIAPALAYGNTVVFKPSSAAIATATMLVELGTTAVPDEALMMVIGGSDIVGRLLNDERIEGVSFTGSAAVGRMLVGQVARRGGSVQAEMGGQNPSLVLDDADLGLASRTIASAAMAYAGQKCTATSRIVVNQSVAAAFMAALVDAVGSLSVGDPLAEDTIVGPVISEAARDRIRDAVEGAVDRGARVLVGEASIDAPGWFTSPTVLQVDDRADTFVQEEVFGPAAAVLIATNDDEAIEIANATRYGLSAAVFSRDLDRATRVASRLRAGLIRVNASTTGVDYYAPFGGERMSSFGPREQGRAARDFYTRSRTLLISRG